MADLYEILSVKRSATGEEIRGAYRKLARKYHPDVNPGDKSAEDRFKEVSAAFEVLSDPEKRKLYDEFGEDAAKIGYDPEKAHAYRQWRDQASASGGWPDGGVGGADFDLSSIFGDLFGFGRRSRGTAHAPPGFGAGPARGSDVTAAIRLPFLDAVRGGERELSLQVPQACSTCGGSGHTGGSGRPCPRCQGTGLAPVGGGPLPFRAPCPQCNGQGRELGPVCSRCGGQGTLAETSHVKVRVPPGVSGGQKIRLAGKGMPGRNGGPPGDLLLEVEVEPHPLLRRDGDDLLLDVPITVEEAMYGGQISVPTLDGSVRLTVPPRSQSGQKLRLRGKGIPARGGKPAGDLYVTLMVQVPTPGDDDDGARRAAQDLQERYAGDPRAGLRL